MRIFWLGAHKLLVKTELQRLRSLGFEVFNPPYNTPVPDQSSQKVWDAQQPSTLPKSAFDHLAKYNFFYSTIDDQTAKILNDYFDAVIVTIHPWWLSEVLRVFKGKVIYRTYGQNELLSEELTRYEAVTQIKNKKDFYFLPFHAQTVADEDDWLKSRALVVPYCIDPDILSREKTWQVDGSKNNKMMVTCPNINNPFYLDHYNYLKKNFSEDTYRFFGVQLSKIRDPQVMGTIPYKQLTDFFVQANGFLYTYKNPRVCYLPPIEMMVVGGPVLYPKGCLLDRMIPNGNGAFVDEAHAKSMVEKLLHLDRPLIQSLQTEQRQVVDLYHPEKVWPIFDREMLSILNSKASTVQKFESVFVLPNYEKAREYLKANPQAPEQVLTQQDVIENYGLFRLQRRLRVEIVSHSVVNFSLRIEKGEFIQHLVDTPILESTQMPPQKKSTATKLNTQIKYLMFRVRDRLKAKVYHHRITQKIIRLARVGSVRLAFAFWLIKARWIDRLSVRSS